MSESTTQAPPASGTICWNELLTNDTGAAGKFFCDLLGWTQEEMNMGPDSKYIMFKQGDTQICGMMDISGPQFEGMPPNWLGYIAVDDVEAMTAKAESLGAKICHPPTEIPNIGRFSVIADPTGAQTGLFQKIGTC